MAVYTTINDPSAYFQTALYNGDSSSVTVTNDGNSNLQPDWLWIKRRSGTGSDHNVFDTSRGLTERIFPNLSSQSDTTNPNGISSLTDGFTTGTSYGNVNGAGQTFVAWQWKANGGTTASNTNGTITSTVQANTTSGFSIVTYTGNATGGATIGHGLGVAPKVVFTKTRAIADNWLVYHEAIGATKYLTLNTTSAPGTSAGAWNNTAPSSTVVTLGSFDNSNDNDNMVAYCFAEKQGFNKFGSYTGNGSADGPFVYTGFKPAFLIIKNTSDGDDQWLMWDNKRSPINPVDDYLEPSTSAAESANSNWAIIDFVSNGFKLRNGDISYNQSGYNYIYMAFAESPFTTSDGVPTTAR